MAQRESAKLPSRVSRVGRGGHGWWVGGCTLQRPPSATFRALCMASAVMGYARPKVPVTSAPASCIHSNHHQTRPPSAAIIHLLGWSEWSLLPGLSALGKSQKALGDQNAKHHRILPLSLSLNGVPFPFPLPPSHSVPSSPVSPPFQPWMKNG